MKDWSRGFAMAAGAVVLLAHVQANAAPAPLVAQVARCRPVALQDGASPWGYANLEQKRPTWLDFGYAVPDASTTPEDALDATQRIEVCWTNGVEAHCPYTEQNETVWLIYDKVNQLGSAPALSRIKVFGAAGAPETWPQEGPVPAHWASLNDAGKYLFILVNGPSNMTNFIMTQAYRDAVSYGGFCPIPQQIGEILSGGVTIFRGFGTLPPSPDPMAPLDSCVDGNKAGVFLGDQACVDPEVADFGLDLVQRNQIWQLSLLMSGTLHPNPPNWQNGEGTACDGPCPMPILYFPDDASHGGRVVNLDATWHHPTVFDPLLGTGTIVGVTSHEYIHSLDTAWDRMGVHQPTMLPWAEGAATAVGALACFEDFDVSIPSDVCASAVRIGWWDPTFINSYVQKPGMNQFDIPYVGGTFLRYAAEQFALPMAEGASPPALAHPSGLNSARRADLSLTLGHRERHSDEGLDILGHIYERFQYDTQHPVNGVVVPPLKSVSTALEESMGRSLETLMCDLHAALVLKDYDYGAAAGDDRFRWMWVAKDRKFNQFEAGDSAAIPYFPQSHPALPPARPFVVPKDLGMMDDGLLRAPRIVDSYASNPYVTNKAVVVTLPKGQALASAQATSIAEYGAAYLSVHPASDYGPLHIRVIPEPGMPVPHVRIFKIEAGVPRAVDECTVDPDGVGGTETTDGCQPLTAPVPQFAPQFSVIADAPTGSKDEVIVIVSAGAQPTSFTWSLGDIVDPHIQIIDPLKSHPAPVGAVTDKRPFLVQFIALDADQNPLGALEDIQISIPDCAATSCTLSKDDYTLTMFDGGVYWAVVTLPDSFYPAGNTFYLDLQISAKGFAPTAQTNALLGGGPASAAMELVLDRSGSMNDNGKIDALKIASKLVVDGLRDEDAIGIVSFNEDAQQLLEIMPVSLGRALAKSTISGILADGCTSIGDGVFEAQSELANAFDGTVLPPYFTSAPNRHAMIVMSDGMNNNNLSPYEYYTLLPGTPTTDGTDSVDPCPHNDPFDNLPWYSGYLRYPERKAHNLKVPTISTVAFGEDADQAELQNLRTPDGSFSYLKGPPSSSFEAKQITTMDLSDSFRQSANAATGHQRTGSLRVRSTDAEEMPSVEVEPLASELLVSLSSGFLDTSILQLVSPLGQTIGADQASAETTVFRVRSPDPGTWTWANKEGYSPGSTDQPSVFVEVAVDSPITMFATADVRAVLPLPSNGGPYESGRFVGSDVILRAILNEGIPITEADVTAVVTRPDGVTHNVILMDDGLHADGVAGDGIFGAVFRKTELAGAYAVRMLAAGTSKLGEAHFSREKNLAFGLHAAPDTDGDGMPDWWELANGTQVGVADAADDPDGDHLSNMDEFLAHTSPLQADTDGEGENDGSEIAAGRDPLDRTDDAISPYIPAIVAGNGKVLIDPQALSTSGVTLEIQRADDPHGAFIPVENATPNADGVVELEELNDREMCYRMRTNVDVGGVTASSAWSPVKCVTPAADPWTPIVTGSRATRDDPSRPTDVTLRIETADMPFAIHLPSKLIDPEVVAEPVVEMMVSEFADFRDLSAWGSFQQESVVSASVDAEVLYIKIRDGAGHESLSYVAWVH
jgi:hypothetical protein